MTLASFVEKLKSGETTSEALVHVCLSAITANERLNAFTRVYDTEAIEQAKASDERRQAGKTLSELDGIPVAIKDNFSYQDHITSAGSNMLKDYVAPYDATVVAKLKAAGAVIVGHLNMDEFAMGSTGESSAFGPTKNPHDTTRVAGGSSSGSAASVAAGMVPLSYGSDTGGSIRFPASFCGIVGLKPTYGAVSRYGLLAMASSFDQIGPLATNVEGVRIGYEAIRGFDLLDSTSTQLATDLQTKDSYRIGIPKQFMGEGLDSRIAAQIEKVADSLTKAGHTIVRDIDMPILDQSIAMYYVIVASEVSANFARYDGIRFGLKAESVMQSRTQGFGDEVKRRIMLGTYALSAGYADQYYKRAQAARAALKQAFVTAFSTVDMLLGPTAPEVAFKLGEKTDDPLSMYLADIYTVPVNLAGVPALSVPSGVVREGDNELPIGIQLIGPEWSEYQLFDIGSQIEAMKEEK